MPDPMAGHLLAPQPVVPLIQPVLGRVGTLDPPWAIVAPQGLMGSRSNRVRSGGTFNSLLGKGRGVHYPPQGAPGGTTCTAFQAMGSQSFHRA